jgi:hypothetical protein
MRAKDLPACHTAPLGPELVSNHAEEDGYSLPWAGEPCEALPSNWEAAWIDLGGEG